MCRQNQLNLGSIDSNATENLGHGKPLPRLPEEAAGVGNQYMAG